MKQLKFTRYSEWWEYKLVPLVSIGYATLLFTGTSIDTAILRLLFLLSAIVIGAVYVSVINDLTDIEEDAKAGKHNWMVRTKPVFRVLILFFCLACGAFFGYFIYPDLLSLSFYAMAWIVFSLYSIPPFRLKKRGVWGVLCDAMGAHLFPGLLITTNLIYLKDSTAGVFWYLSIGSWALLYGLRGILWHQFYDRDNDLKSGTATFASRIKPENFKNQELIIFGLELAAFFVVLFHILNQWILLALLLYIGLVIVRRFAFKYQSCLIIAPSSKPYQLLMNDFYLVFLPLSLLLTLALSNKYGWLVLCVHLILFPQKTMIVIKDLVLFLKKIRRHNSS